MKFQASFLLLLFICLSCDLFQEEEEKREPQGIEINPGDDIQAIVDANPAGTTYILRSGIHRMQEIYPKNGNTFWGESGAILNGSRILTEFEQEGGLYYAPNQTQEGYIHPDPNICSDGWERCTRPEDLFFDNEPLRHVTSLVDVELGKWYFDYEADRIYFADDPADRLVETSVTTWTFYSSGNDVTIKNLIIEKYACITDFGAIGADGRGTGWLVENCEVRLNHGAGIVVGGESIVRENFLHHNGQVGINAGEGANILIESNEISYNNFTGVDVGWGGGCCKFYFADNMQVIGNYVHHNYGHGLWTDAYNTNTLYDGNWVWWNGNDGIKHEISNNVIIRNNDVRYNGLSFDVWLWGSQILIQNSNNGEIYNNTVYLHGDAGNGISIIHQQRLDELGPYYSQNNYFHHNEITHLGLYGSSGIVDYAIEGTEWYYDGDGDGTSDWGCRADDANNLFDYNNYHHQGIPDKFEFCEIYYLTWEQFRAEGQEPNGNMDSNVIVPDDTPPKVCDICPGL